MNIQRVGLFFAAAFGIVGAIHGQSSPLVGHWEGKISRLNQDWKVELDLSQSSDTIKGTADLPDFGLYQLPASASAEGNTLNVVVVDGRDKAEFKGVLDGDEITGTWTGLEVEADFKIKRISPQPTIHCLEQKVDFQQGDAVLAGTLVLPNQAGPHPAIVCTHGSGNQTRTESFYRSRAYLFARHGIASLIYDRRGKGESKGGAESAIWQNLADDAIAGVHLLQARSDIKPKQIGVSGFSQGGWVAPLAALRSKDVAFVLVGSAAAISPEDQNDYNVEAVLRRKSVSDDEIETVMSLREQIKRFQHSQTGDKTQLETKVAQLKDRSWFRNALLPETLEPFDPESKEYITFDPKPVWRLVTVPVLSIWGEQDLNVPAQKSSDIIGAALNDGKNSRYTLRTFPKSGHGLRSIPEDANAWDFPRLAPGYQELMVQWVNEVTAGLDGDPK